MIFFAEESDPKAKDPDTVSPGDPKSEAAAHPAAAAQVGAAEPAAAAPARTAEPAAAAPARATQPAAPAPTRATQPAVAAPARAAEPAAPAHARATQPAAAAPAGATQPAATTPAGATQPAAPAPGGAPQPATATLGGAPQPATATPSGATQPAAATPAGAAEPAAAVLDAAPEEAPALFADAGEPARAKPAPKRARKKRQPPAARNQSRPPPPRPPGPDICDRAIIKVIGIGGGGGNAVNRMIEAGVGGVEFIAANTDAQVLERSLASVKIQLGRERTGGLGCGGDPEIGRVAARDDMDRLIEVLSGADMVFITVGEGGGTGTGAAPVVACVAQEIKALCVAVATKPLRVEGKRRRDTADDGIRELREYVDTLICVPNDRVVAVYGDKPIREAFRDADDVVRQAVQGISDLIQIPGEINLDFADVRAAMRARGDAVMGIGVASGENRVEAATEAAISSPLLEDTSIRGATSIIVNVTGGESLTLNEVQRAAEVVREAVAPENGSGYGSADTEPADNILLGTALESLMDGEEGRDEIKVTVVATGFPERSRAGVTPQDFHAFAARATGAFGARTAPSPGEPAKSPAPAKGAATAKASAPAPAGASGGGSPAAPTPLEAPVADSPPVLDPADSGEDRWGDLETPPYLHRRSSG